MARDMAETSNEHPEVTVRAEDGGTLLIALRGRLDAAALLEIWPKAVEPIRQAAPKRVVVDAAGVTYCDGAGLGLFAELRRQAAAAGGEAEITGLSPELRRLLDVSLLSDPTAGELQPPPPPGFVSKVGQAVADVFADVRDIITFTGELTSALAWAARHPRRVRGRDLWLTAEKVGVNAAPVVCLLGALVGLIMAFQMAVPLQRYGAVSAMPVILGISVTRELGPLITAIILAGRSGSAFAAEIGTMKVTQEVDALQTFGLDPVRFLAIPRVLAAVLMTPLLTMLNIVAGLLCGYLVMINYGYSFQFYAATITSSVSYVDLLGGVGKTLAFGLIVAAIGCMRGLRTLRGPSAVGDSTTRAVVAGIVLIVLADMVFGVVFFYLGI